MRLRAQLFKAHLGIHFSPLFMHNVQLLEEYQTRVKCEKKEKKKEEEISELNITQTQQQCLYDHRSLNRRIVTIFGQ
jgi:hypothetical protein